MNKIYESVQEIYLKKTNNEYGKVIPLSYLEPFTKDFLSNLLVICNLKSECVNYKYELLTFPTWASKEPMYKCGDDYYSHIRLKKPIT